jgi:tRNA dimethylallyltransferase
VPPGAPVLTGIGYAEALMHIRGELPLDRVADVMTRSNKRYARRQLRWLRRNPGIVWFEAANDPVPGILEFLQERNI